MLQCFASHWKFVETGVTFCLQEKKTIRNKGCDAWSCLLLLRVDQLVEGDATFRSDIVDCS